ncbi:glycosyltransferase [Butyrivibrio sp. NC3005]|uniref:glycosyltransferase n=1 Tax=Butyrivibrio sp. NC3005 TaxID=1280685 RepID=UPI0003FCDEFD|nr:glycosyltransferase [Butyrivibrio sp. NC3005]
MNIAIMVPSLGGGGAEKVAKNLGDYYTEKGENVYFFLLNSHLKDVYEVKGEKINTGLESITSGFRGDMKAFFMRLIQMSLIIRKLKRKYHIDVSISFMEECNYLNILSQRGEKVIVRICTILSHRDDLNRYLYNKKIIHFFYSLPCKIVVMSRYAKKDMINSYGVSPKKITIIYNSVNISKVPSHIIEKKNSKEKKVLTVGRLEPVKQQDRIIRSFSYVVDKIPSAKLIIAGKGDNERYLRFVAKKMKIEKNVEFVGFCKNVWEKYGDANCFVMASKVEGFGNSIIEAMVCGIPVVCTNSPGGVQDILGKVLREDDGYKLCQYGIKTNGFTSEKVDVCEKLSKEEENLGKAIVRMLIDEEIKDKYSRMSENRSKKFESSRIYRHWTELF